jgi:hypothetical protein
MHARQHLLDEVLGQVMVTADQVCEAQQSLTLRRDVLLEAVGHP